VGSRRGAIPTDSRYSPRVPGTEVPRFRCHRFTAGPLTLRVTG